MKDILNKLKSENAKKEFLTKVYRPGNIEAVEELSKIASIYDKEIDIIYKEAIFQKNQGNMNKARKFFSKVLEKKSEYLSSENKNYIIGVLRTANDRKTTEDFINGFLKSGTLYEIDNLIELFREIDESTAEKIYEKSKKISIKQKDYAHLSCDAMEKGNYEDALKYSLKGKRKILTRALEAAVKLGDEKMKTKIAKKIFSIDNNGLKAEAATILKLPEAKQLVEQYVNDRIKYRDFFYIHEGYTAAKRFSRKDLMIELGKESLLVMEQEGDRIEMLARYANEYFEDTGHTEFLTYVMNKQEKDGEFEKAREIAEKLEDQESVEFYDKIIREINGNGKGEGVEK